MEISKTLAQHRCMASFPWTSTYFWHFLSGKCFDDLKSFWNRYEKITYLFNYESEKGSIVDSFTLVRTKKVKKKWPSHLHCHTITPMLLPDGRHHGQPCFCSLFFCWSEMSNDVIQNSLADWLWRVIVKEWEKKENFFSRDSNNEMIREHK